VCTERFEQEFDDKADCWRFVRSIKTEQGPIVHTKCHTAGAVYDVSAAMETPRETDTAAKREKFEAEMDTGDDDDLMILGDTLAGPPTTVPGSDG